jgi:hypothetical protein
MTRSRQPPTPIDFVTDEHGILRGEGVGGRRWRVAEVVTGWHLEFWDRGDDAATHAGVHPTLERAIGEAQR